VLFGFLQGYMIYFLFMLPPLAFMFYAQHKVNSAYKKYSKVPNLQRISGGQAARTLLRSNQLKVSIEGTKQQLGDHYDPRHKVLRLSPGVANSPSVASLGIVAHEVGHAVQDKVGYVPMRIRAGLVPAANLGSQLGWIFFFLGLVMYVIGFNFGWNIAWIGVFLFGAAVLFSLVTLPVEYNASRRGKQMLRQNGLVSDKEHEGVSAVLSAAALTYVAALFQAVAQMLFFVFALLGMRR
jgi:hypothetical protein